MKPSEKQIYDVTVQLYNAITDIIDASIPEIMHERGKRRDELMGELNRVVTAVILLTTKPAAKDNDE